MKVEARSIVLRPSIQRGCIPSFSVRGRKTALAISFCSVFSSARERTSSRGIFKLFDELIGLERFMVDFVKTWNAIVPFEQGGGAPYQLHGPGVKLPHGIEYWMIMGIENVLLELRMPRDMTLAYVIVRDVVEVGGGIEIVILR